MSNTNEKIGVLQAIKSPLVFFALSLLIVEVFFTISLTRETECNNEYEYYVAAISSLIMFVLVVRYVFILTSKYPKNLVMDQDGHLKSQEMKHNFQAETSYAKQYDKYSTKAVITLNNTSAEVKEAYEELSDGNSRAAINKFEILSQENNQYCPDLISALSVSPSINDWRRAVDFVDEFGKPEHFRKLAFNFWTSGDINQAITLSEKALSRVNDEDKDLAGSIKNSLAYYYADADKLEKGGKAFEYAEYEVARRGEIPDEQKLLNHYEDALDTLGYVYISFATTKEEVQRGIDLCTESLQLGGNKDLFAKHFEKASAKIKSIEA